MNIEFFISYYLFLEQNRNTYVENLCNGTKNKDNNLIPCFK